MVFARVVRAVAAAVAAVIVIAIILKVLSANPHNVVVSDIHDAGAWLVGPFANVFSVKGANWHMALNWGLAAVVYLAVGFLIANLLARMSLRGGYGTARPVA
ncbi:MAG: hypothetical protein ACJ764_10020 [Solirubrobacteraceae bacterium]